MASTSISGWSGASDRAMTLTATVANKTDTTATLTIKVDISGGESGVNYYDSHLHVYYVTGGETTEVFEDSSPYSDHKWYATRGGSKTWTYTITRTKSAQNIRVHIVGYAYVHSDKSSYVDVTVPVKSKYTISYNANGGSGAPSSQTKWYGEDLTLSSTKPTRTDYTFSGWATSSSGSVAYASGAKYTANASVTLYAVWQGIAPTVTQNVTIASSTKLNLSATANATCNLWRYKLDGGSWTTFSSTAGTSATGTVTVSAGTHTIQIAAKRASNSVYGYGTTQTLDTSAPTVTFSVSDIGTNGFTITATTNVNCNQWWYSLNNGSTWTSYSTVNAKTATIILSELNVNTTYQVKVRAKKTSNNLTGDSSAQSVATQGGIIHLKIGGTWKDAIVYVKKDLAWKQAVCYTKVGSSWRINT